MADRDTPGCWGTFSVGGHGGVQVMPLLLLLVTLPPLVEALLVVLAPRCWGTLPTWAWLPLVLGSSRF